MNPDDFFSNAEYQAYLRRCENSIPSYWEKTQTGLCSICSHPQPCQVHRPAARDGLINYWAVGCNYATHATQPMFKLKPYLDDCGDNYGCCYMCDKDGDNRS